MKKLSKNFKNCKIWVIMLSVFLLSAILGSQAKAGWMDTTGAVYYLGGKVGIGTTNPARQLEISAAGGSRLRITSTIDNNADLEFYTNGISRAIVEANSIGMALGTIGALPTMFVTNNSEKMRIDSTGKVGIGTTVPETLLSLSSTSPVATGIRLDNTANDANNRNWSLGLNQYVYGDFTISQSNAQNGNPVTAATSRFYINNDGNVGIGTTAPAEKLEVSGGANTRIKITSTVDSNADLAFYTNGVARAFVEGNSVGLTAGTISTLPTIFITNNTERMRIDSSGNVGIGTTTPSPDYKLSVYGRIRTKEIVVETGWSDFVFKDDYKLMKLNDLEKNIKENGHLPNIPSASEVAENGVSVGEMQAKLLQKVEELTLYVIDQNKRIVLLERENELLKSKK